MSKIKFLILLSSFLVFFSCTIKIENPSSKNSKKYDVQYQSGNNGFIFKNILTQQLITNNLYEKGSFNVINIELGVGTTYLSTSITKTSSRENNSLYVKIKINYKLSGDCLIFNDNYASSQSFVIASGGANLSNLAAQDDIFIINSKNISERIVSDLLLVENNECLEQ